MDKKIQDAAGNFQPPFQEEDWDSMNMLLDKHLPQEKKKRPFLLGLLFALLVGFPATVMLTTYKALPGISATAQKTSDQSTTINKTEQQQLPPAEKNTTAPSGHDNTTPVQQTPAPEENTSVTTIVPAGRGVITINKRQKIKQQNGTNSPNNVATVRKRNNAPAEPAIAQAPSLAETKTTGSSQLQDTESNPVTSVDAGTGITNTGTDATTVPADSTTTDSLPVKEPLTEKDKTPGNGKGGKWQISLSAGPDLSMIGMEKTGKWKMQYGVGISYALNDRFQIRTGFMASRKLYYADSSDYHPPKGFWSYYPNLQKIDANCLVYEIPLNVVYTFPSKKKHQWFVSTGVSSYLMKEETYEYYFKDTWGQPTYRERTVRNENDHFFSILQLSGGYQYKFSDKFSLMAEPYMKLPLGGVGFGKVKLNNTGMLFTLGYKPFVKRK